MSEQLTEVRVITVADICERLGRLECDVLRIHGVDISDQTEDLIRFYRDGGDAVTIDHDGEGFIARKMCDHCEADEHDGPCEQQP